jgi:NAD(P)H-hydrate repair Nnr-like enzyme with NAD(P)H-hydrate epimerase domain
LRGQLFVPLEHDIQRATTRVLEYAERMVGMGKGRNGADPFVIALAVARDGVVVTEEYKGSLASPKIPVVREALRVRCMTTVEFIQDQGWTF